MLRRTHEACRPRRRSVERAALLTAIAACGLSAARPDEGARAAPAPYAMQPVGGAATGVVVENGLAYAVIGVQVVAFDATVEPRDAPRVLFTLPEVAEDLAVDGEHLFVASRGHGRTGAARLVVLDVRDRSGAASLVADVHLPATGVGAIAVGYGRAVLATDAGVVVLSVKDPADPRVTARLPAVEPGADGSAPVDITILAGRALVAGPGGVTVVDLADPSTGVVRVDRRPTVAVAALGGRGFALRADGTLTGLDVAPAGITSVDHPGVAAAPLALAAEDRRLWLVDQAGRRLRGVDLGVDGTPSMVEQATLASFTSPGAGLAVAGDRVFVALDRAGVVVWRSAEAAHVTVPIPGIVPPIVDAALSGDYVVGAAGEAGVFLVDVGGRESPAMRGALRFVRASDGAVTAHAVAAATPSTVGSEDGVDVLGIAVDGPVVFVCTGGDGLLVVDVAAPDRPRLRGHVPAVPGCHAGAPMTVAGRRLYMSTVNRELAVVDVSDRFAPRLIADGVAGIHGVTSLAVDGRHLFAAGFTAMTAGVLHVLDVSGPGPPRHVTRADFPHAFTRVAASHDQVYLAGALGDLTHLTFQPPAALTPGRSYPGLVAGRVGLSGPLMFAAQAEHLDTLLLAASGALHPVGRLALPRGGDGTGESDVLIGPDIMVVERGRAGLLVGAGPEAMAALPPGWVAAPPPDRAGIPPGGAPPRGPSATGPDPARVAGCGTPSRIVFVADGTAAMRSPFGLELDPTPGTVAEVALAGLLAVVDVATVEIAVGRFDRQGELVQLGGARHQLEAAARMLGALGPNRAGRLDLALDVAAKVREHGGTPIGRHTLVLLAGGHVDPAARDAARRRADELADDGWRVHTVAVGDHADRAFLARLASAPEAAHAAVDRVAVGRVMREVGDQASGCR